MSLVLRLLLALVATDVFTGFAPASSSAFVAATKTTPVWLLLWVELRGHDILRRGHLVIPSLLIRPSAPAPGFLLLLAVGVKPCALLVSGLNSETYKVLFVFLHQRSLK